MNNSRDKLIRGASAIRDALLERTNETRSLTLPEAAWRRLVGLMRQLPRARNRGWKLAAKRIEREIADEVGNVEEQLSGLAATWRRRENAPPVPSLADVHRDLVSMEDEFEQVSCDLELGELCATTSAIIFDGIRLGAFEIRLVWTRINSAEAYRIVALEPNPAASNESVTHPHVSDEALCEGDGRSAIRTALAEGRLFDFFLVVRQLLTTYGRGRAYVDLNSWNGLPCHDCGNHASEDERSYCTRCDVVLCGDCVSYCTHCDYVHCAGCLTTCPACQRSFCDACCQSCSSCGETFCSDCLTDGKCSPCDEKDVQDDDSEATEPMPTDASVQPDGLGEAPLLA